MSRKHEWESPYLDIYEDYEIERLFREDPAASAEYDNSFLGFAHCYEAVADHLDTRFHVHDVGCCSALQARMFDEFAGYTGVDLPRDRYDIAHVPAWDLFDDVPGDYVEADGADYLDALAETCDMDRTFVITSAMPSERVRRAARRFRYALDWYPGEEVTVRGNGRDFGMLFAIAWQAAGNGKPTRWEA